MDSTHRVGETNCANLGDDWVGTEILLREFLGWSGRPKVLGLDKYLTTDFEIRCG